MIFEYVGRVDLSDNVQDCDGIVIDALSYHVLPKVELINEFCDGFFVPTQTGTVIVFGIVWSEGVCLIEFGEGKEVVNFSAR